MWTLLDEYNTHANPVNSTSTQIEKASTGGKDNHLLHWN